MPSSGLSGTNATQQPVDFGMQTTNPTDFGAAGSGGPTTVGDLMGCTSTSVDAPPATNPKVDIVWVVDASGSMLDEQQKIGQNITQFANDITAANLDVHIVMITTAAGIPVICPPYPPDPAANTALAGDARYRFLDIAVDSHNLLDMAWQSISLYSDFLRPDASLHYVFVTDDESQYKNLGSVQERVDGFIADMEEQAQKTFAAHTISSPGPTPCVDPMCMPDLNTGLCAFAMLGCGAAAVSETYWSLAESTSGLTSSICQSDWSGVFGPLTQAVIESAPLPCNYIIPPPPLGQSLDSNRVNVGYWRAGAPQEEVFPKATGDAASCGDAVAWYYNPAQTEVLLCPAACQHVEAGGRINIAFGCDTIVVK